MCEFFLFCIFIFCCIHYIPLLHRRRTDLIYSIELEQGITGVFAYGPSRRTILSLTLLDV